jgi:hypothetical protein
MTTDVTCPSCGTVSYYDELNRDASAFCRECDYPLFWARTSRTRADSVAVGDAGQRRLPGTVGRITVVTVPCPVCFEPNTTAADVCIRCGADMHPPPPPPPPPPPEPKTEPVVVVPPAPPPPEPEPRPGWTVWILIGAAAALAVILLVLLLTT